MNKKQFKPAELDVIKVQMTNIIATSLCDTDSGCVDKSLTCESDDSTAKGSFTDFEF